MFRKMIAVGISLGIVSSHRISMILPIMSEDGRPVEYEFLPYAEPRLVAKHLVATYGNKFIKPGNKFDGCDYGDSECLEDAMERLVVARRNEALRSADREVLLEVAFSSGGFGKMELQVLRSDTPSSAAQTFCRELDQELPDASSSAACVGIVEELAAKSLSEHGFHWLDEGSTAASISELSSTAHAANAAAAAAAAAVVVAVVVAWFLVLWLRG